MRYLTNTAAVLCVILTLAAAAPAGAQSRTDQEKTNAQREVNSAESALVAAEAAGAATLAPALFNEAKARLEVARRDWNSTERDARIGANLRAIEAGHAARAAEAQAALVAANNEIRSLRTAISTAGGSPVAVTFYDPPGTISRGVTSMDRVITAENAVRDARGAGGESVAPALLQHAEATLKTARTLAKNNEQNASADHLAYVAEMVARRAEFMARRNAIAHHLPALRDQRTRLASVPPPVETQSVVVIDQSRLARMAAERELEVVQRRYQEALREGRLSQAEVDALRRQVNQQSETLRTLQERERSSEATRANEIQTLEGALARERNEGRLTAEALAQREEELRRHRDELDRLRREREESERVRLEAERAYSASVAEAERLRNEAAQQSAELRQQIESERARATQTEAQSAELQKQVEAERARATQTEAQLAAARDELARRDAASIQRIETMQAELAKLAQTRTTERGFIVTLPGLFFDSGKSVLKAGARNALAKIADQLRVNTELDIAIEGHTDSVGSDALNQSLSEKRAAAVRDYLVSRGLPADRMTTTGLGETAPVASNDTPSGRQQNRRVELIIAQSR
jgi:outer membrane protein OmpA-like peptidoglycan-associated protein